MQPSIYADAMWCVVVGIRGKTSRITVSLSSQTPELESIRKENRHARGVAVSVSAKHRDFLVNAHSHISGLHNFDLGARA